jgi:hypothetical protein
VARFAAVAALWVLLVCVVRKSSESLLRQLERQGEYAASVCNALSSTGLVVRSTLPRYGNAAAFGFGSELAVCLFNGV